MILLSRNHDIVAVKKILLRGIKKHLSVQIGILMPGYEVFKKSVPQWHQESAAILNREQR
jgi:hypothetical protein